MTDIEEVALAFCRECMRWEDARTRSDRLDPAETECAIFDYSDLNVVLEAVSAWCQRQGKAYTLSLTYVDGEYLGLICDQTVPLHELAISECSCHALMAACLAASRNLKAS